MLYFFWLWFSLSQETYTKKAFPAKYAMLHTQKVWLLININLWWIEIKCKILQQKHWGRGLFSVSLCGYNMITTVTLTLVLSTRFNYLSHRVSILFYSGIPYIRPRQVVVPAEVHLHSSAQLLCAVRMVD